MLLVPGRCVGKAIINNSDGKVLSVFLIHAVFALAMNRKDRNHCNSRSPSGDCYVALIRADGVIDPEGHNLCQ